MGGVPYEPSADMRTLARGLKDMYEALVAEGFSERQAITIGEVLAANAKGQQQ